MSKETRRDMKQRTARKGYVRPVREAMDKGGLRIAETALKAFVECVDMTGGVEKVRANVGRDGFAPVADLEWLDLGEAYMLACSALGRDPKVAP